MHASITIHVDWMCLGAENNSTLITRTVETLEHTAITDIRDFRYSCQHIHFWSLHRVLRQLRLWHTKRFATSFVSHLRTTLFTLSEQPILVKVFFNVHSVFLMSLDI
jgi:hypothetical protein